MSQTTGSIFPSPDILSEFEEGKFVLSNLAAKRAKQLRDGAPPLVRIESNHPLTIALAEIAAGKIKPILGKEEAERAIVETEMPTLEEGLPSEMGILLPALDEHEAELVGVASLVEGDIEHEEELEIVPTASLTDLLDEHEVEEAVAVEPEEDTMSLTDIAEQENLDEEEESHE